MRDRFGREVHQEYADIRDQMFALGATSENPTDSDVVAAVMDVGFELGAATLVALPDGTTTLYTSGGGAIVGAGEQEDVAAATKLYVSETRASLPDFVPSNNTDLPAPDDVTLRALTQDANYAVTVSVEQLRLGTHPLSRVYAAAQLVVTAVQAVVESPDVEG
jgi:hypothetical protein